MKFYLSALLSMAVVTAGAQRLSAYNQYLLFTPSTFFHSVASNNLSLNQSSQDAGNQEINSTLMNAYLNHPDMIVDSENQLRHAGEVK